MVHHLLVLHHATVQPPTSLVCFVTSQSMAALYALLATSALMVLRHVQSVLPAFSTVTLGLPYVKHVLLVHTAHSMVQLSALHALQVRSTM